MSELFASLPEGFCRRMKELLGEEYEAFLASCGEEKVQGLRINPLKKRPGARAFLTERFALQPVFWCPDGYYYQEGVRPGRNALHEAGAYYIQEPSAMSVAELAFFDRPDYGEVGEPERVLDLCAAPGGKSTQLAAIMRGKGLLWANEYHPARAKILSRNLERMGAANAIVSNETVQRLAKQLPLFFDRIIVDAPCSGEGMFRKKEEAVQEWSEDNIALCAQRQREILAAADAMLRPGGLLVYSTCTFAPEENEQTIERFLEENAEKGTCYELLDLREVTTRGGEKRFGDCFLAGRSEAGGQREAELARCFRLFPHRLRGEGHFAAVLRKQGEDTKRELSFSGREGGRHKRGRAAGAKERERKAMLKSGLEPLVREADALLEGGRLCSFGEQWYRIPEETPELEGLRVLRPGLQLGTERAGRLEPAHALALALSEQEARRSLSLPETDPRIESYLRGESFPFLGEKGFYLLCVEGFSLGWGKCDGKTMKNHYPKGLRINWEREG